MAFADSNQFPDEDLRTLLELAADLGQLPAAPTVDSP